MAFVNVSGRRAECSLLYPFGAKRLLLGAILEDIDATTFVLLSCPTAENKGL